jgi:hypothetical protein
MTDALLSWLSSYLLHSSLLGRLSHALQESLWRLALLGGLVSASLGLLPPLPGQAQSAEAPVQAVVRLDLAAVPQAAEPTRAAVEAPRAPDVLAASARPDEADEPDAASPGDPRFGARLGRLALTGLAPLVAQAHDLAVGFVALWLAGAVLMLLGLGLQWAWLHRVVRRLPGLDDPRWTAWTAQIAAACGLPAPALRQARPGWASPLLAPGRVLCLPAWCLDLPEDEACAVLGHELAHLRRRDPAWRLLAAAVRALLWPQALNRIALQRLDLLAELACDAAAAAPAGQRLALAQSLLRCAEALKGQGGGHGPALACGAASAGSPLFARVRRLLQAEPDAPRERRALRWGLLAAVLATLAALPVVVVSHADAHALLDRFGLDGLADRLDSHSFLPSPGVTRILSRYPGGSFLVTLDGKLGFNEAEDDVQTLTGRLLVREREGGLTREMRLTSMGEGRVEREYRVGRETRPMDAAAGQWWAQAVRRMAETLTDPLVRAQKLFAKGGMPAVLADLEAARDDFARRQRLDTAVKLGQPLDAAALDRLIAAAASVSGGFDRREALSAVARLPLADAQQLAWLKAVGGIDGDFDRREALGALAPRLSAAPAVIEAWNEALTHIGGDFELRSAIEAQVAATPQPAVLRSALQAAARLGGATSKSARRSPRWRAA